MIIYTLFSKSKQYSYKISYTMYMFLYFIFNIMSKDWFTNEHDISSYLNWKRIKEVNPNLKKFIRFMFWDVGENSIIKSKGVWWTNKADVYIEINWIRKNISIKKWTGNSVHQEPVEEFIDFLRESYPDEADEEIFNDIRFFIRWDLTLDWTWRKEDRMSSTALTKKYPNRIKTINDYFSNKKEDLIRRFVINWAKSNISADYVYHWTITSWKWEEANKLVQKIVNEENNGAIPIWALTFQAWNRGIWEATKEVTEKKRWVIQLKFWWILDYLIS